MAEAMDSAAARSRRGIEIALTGVSGWIALRVLGRFAPKLGLTSSASDTEVLLETAAIVALAYGLWRGSRASALLLFFVLTPTAISALISSSGRPFAALGYAAISVAVFLGIPATWRLHARGAAGPPTLRRKIFVALAVASGAAVLGLLVALGYFGQHAPPLQVVYGAQIPRNYVEGIRELGVLEPGEKVRFFYSTGVFDFRDGMYVLTDRRLVLANPEWSEPLIDIPLEEVRELDVEYEDEGTWLEDTIVSVVRADGEVFSFPLATSGRGDRRFFEALRDATLPEDERGGAVFVQ